MLLGPCLSEVGFEVLYWVPMLRRLAERHGVDPSRVVAVSRGGAETWYEGIADRYVDVLDLYGLEEYRARLDARRAETASEKQATLTEFDREILERARHHIGLDDPIVVHPSLMVTRLRYYWAGETDIRVVRRNTGFKRLNAGPVDDIDLPGEYAAVKPYFSSCFPDTDENRRFVHDLVARLAASMPVVVLPGGFGLDDHGECEVPDMDGVVRIQTGITARNNLSVQTRIVAGAQALFTTYGGFAYVGSMAGVDTTGLYAEANFNRRHLAVARLAALEIGAPEISLLDVARGADRVALPEAARDYPAAQARR